MGMGIPYGNGIPNINVPNVGMGLNGNRKCDSENMGMATFSFLLRIPVDR